MNAHPPGNRLLDALDSSSCADLLAQSRCLDWRLGESLAEPRQRALHLHFPLSGFASLMVAVDGHPGVETAMIGREGVLGAALLLGLKQEPQQVVVQGAGRAWRVALAPLRLTLSANPEWQALLLRYVGGLMAQGARSAACLHYHAIVPRLARWLLMSQDRALSPHFQLTQEFLSCMLGVRRVGVTQAAGRLREQGLIRYQRGELQVLDRDGLLAQACSCYIEDRRLGALAYRPQRAAPLKSRA